MSRQVDDSRRSSGLYGFSAGVSLSRDGSFSGPPAASPGLVFHSGHTPAASARGSVDEAALLRRMGFTLASESTDEVFDLEDATDSTDDVDGQPSLLTAQATAPQLQPRSHQQQQQPLQLQTETHARSPLSSVQQAGHSGRRLDEENNQAGAETDDGDRGRLLSSSQGSAHGDRQGQLQSAGRSAGESRSHDTVREVAEDQDAAEAAGEEADEVADQLSPMKGLSLATAGATSKSEGSQAATAALEANAGAAASASPYAAAPVTYAKLEDQHMRRRSAPPTMQVDLGQLANSKDNDEEVIRSRRGTFMGRKGSLSDLRKRFQQEKQDKLQQQQHPAPLPEEPDGQSRSSPALLPSDNRRRSLPALSSTGSSPGFAVSEASEGGGLSSRRGSIVGRKGMVSNFRTMFVKKAESSTQPKSLADKCIEEEEAMAKKKGGIIIVYTTSVSTVKETFWNCQKLTKILETHRVQYEERDVILSKDFRQQLQDRLPNCSVPQVFLNGKHLGGLETVETLNENEELAKAFAGVPKLKDGTDGKCTGCGGKGFVVCEWCGGDRRSVMSKFGKELVKLRCTVCNEHGLMRCPMCRPSTVLVDEGDSNA